ncbi:nitrate reductase cytochrome c-type subunit [Sneathiella aquimaris]|uniref:nitrate reductase cytochrome c-type subunit n=1 Tax=Sneathiella aquimaris TaxID=2599305 RepID=UPI002260E195|nr:nitrate reductase cytochrome c-type subunit [Sneathiella aquimaris]
MKSLMKFGLVLAGLAIISVPVLAEDMVTLRKGIAIEKEAGAPVMPKVENKDVKRVRNYPEQPPTIPHHVRDYEVTKNANKCLSCHARTRTGESQAPMVSVTHFMDRDNQVLATVSPRRYFCNQCHVVQEDVKPLIENTFTDVEDVLKTGKDKQ